MIQGMSFFSFCLKALFRKDYMAPGLRGEEKLRLSINPAKINGTAFTIPVYAIFRKKALISVGIISPFMSPLQNTHKKKSKVMALL